MVFRCTIVFLLACAVMAAHASGAVMAQTLTVCEPGTAACPEVKIEGYADATAIVNNFRFYGHGDPSLERDKGGSVWLIYSWLQTLKGPKGEVGLGVSTRLARAENSAANFADQGLALNAVTMRINPLAPTQGGWEKHEVPALVRGEAATQWQALWLTYFDPYPGPVPIDYKGLRLQRASADKPAGLAAQTKASADHIRGYTTEEVWVPGALNLSGLETPTGERPLSDCMAFSEPSLHAEPNGIYLALVCVVIDPAKGARTGADRIILLQQTKTGYEYLGVLLAQRDAKALNPAWTRHDQPEIVRTRNGKLALIATPMNDAAAGGVIGQGCNVYEVEDLKKAALRRDAAGKPVIVNAITSTVKSSLGPGACTYDAGYDPGVMMVIPKFVPVSGGLELRFRLYATQVHPAP